MTEIRAALVAAMLALTGAALLDFSLAHRLQTKPFDVAHVPRGSFARIASLGNRGLMSDIYWLTAVQYIGDKDADARGWDKLLPLLDLVTDLDPRHGYAYQTGGIVLSAAGRIADSNAILLKGLSKGPDWWTFPYYLAFNYWFYLGDYAEGARYAEIAARRPGASANISHLAVSLASKSGTPEDAIALILELRQTVKDRSTLARLDEQLKLAVLERDAQQLEQAAKAYEARFGLPLPDLEALVTYGLVPAIPPDPFGGRYVWNLEEKKVHSSVNPFRFRASEGAHLPKFQYEPKASGDDRQEARP
ncbi:MAG TPA: tetratricopeptide repeat protein [Anaeromyxobacteraceae bacterium]|nr:tetratricopeptide repeat protein [Anaeromyxobacteraceae bacterium]